MRAFLQSFKLELISALRSKTVLLFTVACTLWMLLGRYLLKGDGFRTYQLSVRYLLGVVFAVVLVALGSAAAGTLAKDRAAKRLQLALIRPAPRFLMAMARSLAIAATGAAVLALAFALLWACEGRGRICDSVYAPTLENPRVEARRMFDDLYKTKPEFRADVEKVGRREILKYLESLVRDRYVSVAPGKSAYWTFDSVPPDAKGAKVRVRFDDSWGRTGSISGMFAFRNRKGSVGNPVRAVSCVDLDEPYDAGTVSNRLVFVNNSNASLNIQPRNDLDMLVPADSFAHNAFRAWLMMSMSLLCVVSFAVFLGACLGRSVAVFVLVSALCVMVVSPATMEEYPDPVNANSVTRFSVALAEFSSWLTSPVDRFSPVAALEADERVPWSEVGSAAATGVLSLVFFSLSAGFMMPRKTD